MTRVAVNGEVVALEGAFLIIKENDGKLTKTRCPFSLRTAQAVLLNQQVQVEYNNGFWEVEDITVKLAQGEK